MLQCGYGRIGRWPGRWVGGPIGADWPKEGNYGGSAVGFGPWQGGIGEEAGGGDGGGGCRGSGGECAVEGDAACGVAAGDEGSVIRAEGVPQMVEGRPEGVPGGEDGTRARGETGCGSSVPFRQPRRRQWSEVLRDCGIDPAGRGDGAGDGVTGGGVGAGPVSSDGGPRLEGPSEYARRITAEYQTHLAAALKKAADGSLIQISDPPRFGHHVEDGTGVIASFRDKMTAEWFRLNWGTWDTPVSVEAPK